MKRVKQAAKKYFIPQAENDFKPHLLRGQTIAFVCMVVLVAESAFVFGAKYIIPSSKLFGIVEANALVDETNQNRVENNLPDLQVSPLLQEAAQEKANDMATKGYFAHTSPQGLTPWYWFEQVGYNFDYAGENLAVNFSDSQDVTTAWMNSPEHRANILSTDYTQIGIATAQGIYNGEPTTYVVEEFGTPAPAAAPVAFVDTASAATTPAATPTPAPATTTTKPSTPTVTKKPAVKTTPVAAIPVVVAMQSSSAPAMQQTFIAVQNVATQTVPTAATAPSVGVTAAAAPLPDQSNLIQTLFSDPKTMANDFYLFLMILFVIALVLNIFVNIRVQYPRLILGGVLVIVVAGLCIILNQNIGFLHTTII
jgi:hypothetical protein